MFRRRSSGESSLSSPPTQFQPQEGKRYHRYQPAEPKRRDQFIPVSRKTLKARLPQGMPIPNSEYIEFHLSRREEVQRLVTETGLSSEDFKERYKAQKQVFRSLVRQHAYEDWIKQFVDKTLKEMNEFIDAAQVDFEHDPPRSDSNGRSEFSRDADARREELWKRLFEPLLLNWADVLDVEGSSQRVEVRKKRLKNLKEIQKTLQGKRRLPPGLGELLSVPLPSDTPTFDPIWSGALPPLAPSSRTFSG